MLPRFVTSPIAASQSAICTKPSTVSLTKVKSRVGWTEPTRISRRPESTWVRIVGMMARADCRGPKVLKGRSTATGWP